MNSQETPVAERWFAELVVGAGVVSMGAEASVGTSVAVVAVVTGANVTGAETGVLAGSSTGAATTTGLPVGGSSGAAVVGAGEGGRVVGAGSVCSKGVHSHPTWFAQSNSAFMPLQERALLSQTTVPEQDTDKEVEVHTKLLTAQLQPS